MELCWRGKHNSSRELCKDLIHCTPFCVLSFTTIHCKHDDPDLAVIFGQFGGYKPSSSFSGRLCYPISSLYWLEPSSFHCKMGLPLLCIPVLHIMTVIKKVCIHVLQASLV